ncbi:leucine-rich repeat protein (LRRP) [Trypanosoma brucei equiperdum]|uniref:Leucine-rich repeat protein (LRRP) n=1 Tax=Trypanosoma brucei equiperdum TaxID=630700 RepID=A0A3L6KSF8_9TRYP|nr:leucine-rich repeat protein (LRRP) [Trypanosoma brucei equiperdum]
MHAGTPTTRAATPVRSKHQPLLMPARKRALSPIPQRLQQRPSFGVPSPKRNMLFQRVKAQDEASVSLPDETIRELRNTRSLFLCCRNLLSFGHIQYLEHMTNLSSLNVHMNAISRLECLFNLRNLAELDVSANELRDVDEGAFVGLCKLRRLNLSSNFLTSLSGFKHLPALEWLSVSFNELEDLGEVQQLPCPQKLVYLDVCGNKIPSVANLVKPLGKCCDLAELRVEVPRAALLLPTTPPQLQLRENPFCATESNYVERILSKFKRLKVLNGVPCGCDLTEDLHVSSYSAAASEGPLTKDNGISVRECKLHPITAADSRDTASRGELRDAGHCRKEVVGAADTSGVAGNEVRNSNDCDGSGSFLNVVEITCSSEGLTSPVCVSRGVTTDLSVPPHRVMHLSSTDDVAAQKVLEDDNAHLKLSLRRLQEQLSLRVALEEDLRRSLEEARRNHASLVESSELESKRFGRQIDALKDELSRRAQESGVLERQHRANLEKQMKNHKAAMRELRQREAVRAAQDLEEKLSQVHKEADKRSAELQERVDSTLKQNEWLQKMNVQIEERVKQLQAEFLLCEQSAKLCEKRYLLMLEECSSRHAVEVAALNALVSSGAAYLHLWQHHGRMLLVSHSNNQQEWKEYTSKLKKHYEGIVTQLHAAQAARGTHFDVACDPIVVSNENLRMDEEVPKLQEALSLARESEQLVSRENVRLLSCVAAMEKELADSVKLMQEHQAAARSAQDEFTRERDNLLRTLHNLRDTIRKKDTAYDELEAEAEAKIDEKRAIIAKLEARLEEARESAECQREEAAKLLRVEEELRRVKAEFSAIEKDASLQTTTQQPQLKELMDALDDSKRKLATLAAREHQQSVKLARAAEALMLVRGQLVRLDEVNTSLTNELSEREAALRAATTENRHLQQQLQEIQETERARHRAALQTLSQLMVGGIEGATRA